MKATRLPSVIGKVGRKLQLCEGPTGGRGRSFVLRVVIRLTPESVPDSGRCHRTGAACEAVRTWRRATAPLANLTPKLRRCRTGKPSSASRAVRTRGAVTSVDERKQRNLLRWCISTPIQPWSRDSPFFYRICRPNVPPPRRIFPAPQNPWNSRRLHRTTFGLLKLGTWYTLTFRPSGPRGRLGPAGPSRPSNPPGPTGAPGPLNPPGPPSFPVSRKSGDCCLTRLIGFAAM